jgi:hypothetical protein
MTRVGSQRHRKNNYNNIKMNASLSHNIFLGAEAEEIKIACVSHKQNLIQPSFILIIQEDNTRVQVKTVRCKDLYKYCGRGSVLVLGNKGFVKRGARIYGEWI